MVLYTNQQSTKCQAFQGIDVRDGNRPGRPTGAYSLAYGRQARPGQAFFLKRQGLGFFFKPI